jgi:hypothetical protein
MRLGMRILLGVGIVALWIASFDGKPETMITAAILTGCTAIADAIDEARRGK